MNTIDFERLKLSPGARVLDLGCGLGRHSLLAYRDYPVQVFALDLDFPDLSQAKKRQGDMEQVDCQGSLAFIHGSGFSLPFADESFDVVICSEVLEHIPAYEEVLKEIIRVLKADARLALSVPKFLPEKLCWLFSAQYPDLAGHVRIFRAGELESSVCTHGLGLVDRHSAHALHSPYWWLRSLFFEQGEDFFLTRLYKRFMDWSLFQGPAWLSLMEALLNPCLGKSNVYYFDKNRH